MMSTNRNQSPSPATREVTPAHATPEVGSAQPRRWRIPVLVFLLVAVTVFLYWPVHRFPFINYDDPDYVTANRWVQQGLSAEGVAWAFGRISGDYTYWHPLTWLSHMLDVEGFGLNAGAHHVVSVVWHAANAALLFLLLLRMTQQAWPSVLAAACFAWHPLQVESVVWITERKNLLSTFLWLVTLWAYVGYARRPSRGRYGLVMLGLGLGLMAKPTLVTLPFTLLLLDVWPLGRLAQGDASGVDRPGETLAGGRYGLWLRWWPLVVEKVPLLLLSAAGSSITLLAHANLQLSPGLERLPLDSRVAHALVGYGRYLGKVVWPADLAVFYPYGAAPSGWQVIGAVLLLGVVTWAVIRHRRRAPYLAVGWCWFLGTLVPVIGLIQAGEQGMADRFMYVPLIGLAVAVAWGLADWTAARPGRRRWLAPIVGAGLAGCVVGAAFQVRHWQSTESLMRHALSVTLRNYVAHGNLAAALAAERRFDEAAEHYELALRLLPRSADLHYNLAWTLAQSGHWAQAQPHYEAALELRPAYAAAHTGLAQALLTQGLPVEAMLHLQEAIRLEPAVPANRLLLGLASLQENRPAEAAAQFEEMLRLQPNDPVAYRHLGDARLAQGRLAEAVRAYREALRVRPDFLEVLNNLAWLLATSPQDELRDGLAAEAYARRACELSDHKVPVFLGTLAAALAAAGRFNDAAQTAEQAVRVAEAAGLTNLVAQNQKLAALYRAGQPYREPAVIPAR